MLSRVRFFLYRQIISFFSWISFLTQKVYTLEPPTGGAALRFRPYATAFPGMPIGGIYDAEDFPDSDRAAPRLRQMKVSKSLLSLAGRIAPRQTPPVPTDEKKFQRIVYPLFFRLAWRTAPRAPRELVVEGSDVVAALATNGPFASYLRRANAGDVNGGDATAEQYVLDLSWFLGYDVAPGVVPPGGKAILEVDGSQLRTVAIRRKDGRDIRPGSAEYPRARQAFLAALNEDLTTFRHNLATHLTTLTSFALVSANHLPANHPVRRLLHHTFHTVLIGNREVASFQLSGAGGYSATIFSHDAAALAKMAGDYLARYDVWDFEPAGRFASHGTASTPFDYPYRDNVMRVWKETYDYVEAYLRLYYGGDAAVRADPALADWVDALDRLLPNGVHKPAEGITREWLARLCATLLHHSTMEHDFLNNVVWNYSTLGWIIPTVALESGEPMDQRRAFDLVATIIGTWKPYNMLLTADVPSLALDERGRAAMQRWIDRLSAIQKEMSALPPQPGLSYPVKWNPSISN